jgi:hypothetical protein
VQLDNTVKRLFDNGRGRKGGSKAYHRISADHLPRTRETAQLMLPRRQEQSVALELFPSIETHAPRALRGPNGNASPYNCAFSRGSLNQRLIESLAGKASSPAGELGLHAPPGADKPKALDGAGP